LGPLYEPYHLAVGGSNGDIYVASESTDIIVVDGNTYDRIKRISTGTPVGGVCLVARHNKLYCSYPAQGRVGILDCASNSIVGSIQVGAGPKKLCHNFLRDKLYCADTADGTVSVIDCASGSVVANVAVGTNPGVLAYDETTDKMYVATPAALVAIGCAADTVVARIGSVTNASALCCSRRNQKLYAIHGSYLADSLTIVATPRDSVIAAIRGARGFSSCIALNDATDRVFVVDSGHSGADTHVWQIDGAGDTVSGYSGFMRRRYYRDMVCDTVRNLVYLGGFNESRHPTEIAVLDGNTLEYVARPPAGRVPDELLLDSARGRVLCASRRGGTNWGGDASSLLVVDTRGESLVAVVPLEHTPLALDCRNGVAGRLYYKWGYDPGGVGVIDEWTGRVVAQISLGQWVTTLAYSSTSGMLYCGTDSGLAVIDGSGDSLLKSLNYGDHFSQIRWYSPQDKLYCLDDDPDPPVVIVLDCHTDSIVATVQLRADVGEFILAERQKMLYCFFSNGGFQVLHCGDDNIVVDSVTAWGVMSHAYSPEENKLYIGRIGHLNTYQVWPCSLVISHDWPYAGADQLLACSDSTHKLYWKANTTVVPPPGDDSIKVLDTRSDTLIATLSDTFRLYGSCLDHTGRFLWLVSEDVNSVVVYDTRTDTMAAVLGTPLWPWAILSNPAFERVYVGVHWSAILVYPDSVSLGLAVEPSHGGRALPSTVQKLANVHLSDSGPWFDVAGRRVATRTQAAGRLEVSPGVYICPRLGCAATKIVVVR
jgi:YVTN family beta-propeller protein